MLIHIWDDATAKPAKRRMNEGGFVNIHDQSCRNLAVEVMPVIIH